MCADDEGAELLQAQSHRLAKPKGRKKNEERMRIGFSNLLKCGILAVYQAKREYYERNTSGEFYPQYHS